MKKPVWRTPFCANASNLDCPKCRSVKTVMVREKETYFSGDSLEAYCADCHATLEVQVEVEVTFYDPEVVK